MHYLSIVAVDDECPATKSEDPHDRDPETSGVAHLVIELSADGAVKEVLGRLSTTLGAELEEVLAAAGIARRGEPLA